MGDEGKLRELERLEQAARKLRGELGLAPNIAHQPALSKREALLVEAERVAHLGSWTWNLQTDEIVWSDEFYRILGLDPAQIEPSSPGFFAAVHPDDLPTVEGVIRRAFETGVPEAMAFRFVRPGGETRHVTMQAAFVCDSSGQPQHVVGTVLDETEKRQAEALLARTVAELNDAHDVAGLGSWRWDLTDKRLEWSPSMYRIMGIEGQPAPTRELFYAHVHPADVEHVASASAKAMELGTPLLLDMRIVRDDGTMKHVTLRSHHIFDAAGKPSGLHGIVQDVTERRALEEQVRHSQKMEAVGTLAGGVAHDFNNYLLILGGHVELLAAQLPGDHVLRRSLEAIEHACGRCATLTQQLLTLSRKRPSQPRRLDLAKLVESMAATLRSALGATIELQLELDHRASPVFADPAQLEQVLMNLVLNARDATPDGGKVTISLAEVSDERLGVDLAHHVRLTVRDTGCGIPEELQSRIFEPFFTTKAVGRGTGLGLSVVYGIIQDAGGRIDVESKPGSGSAFHVWLRPAPVDVKQELEDVARAAPRGRGQRILLVEDVGLARELLEGQLKDAGYRVLTAEHGEAALALLAGSEEVHAIISDMVMPQMGGERLALELRERYPHVPVLWMTGHSREWRGDPSPDSPRALLRKPFTARQLLSELSKLLGAAGSKP